jgi:hypothetical protein
MIFGACQSCEAPPLQWPYLEIAIAKKLVCWQIREWDTRTCLLSIWYLCSRISQKKENVHIVSCRLINIYIYWLSRLWIYHYFEYVDCNIWFLALVSLAKLHPFNAHIWKSPPPKNLFVDKYENETHAPVYYQYDTYVAEFHKVH